jgi:L-asparaginase
MSVVLIQGQNSQSGMAGKQKAQIFILFTGGTISMRFDTLLGGVVPAFSGEQILAQVPGLKEIAEIQPVDFARLPGPHMGLAQMIELSRSVQSRLGDGDVDGIVITHGTDTLEETAYLLDLVLRSEKPVVLVGAMRNHSEPGWDGPANLLAAVRVAAEPAAQGFGVLVVMDGKILAGSEATKTHTEAMHSFQSRDFGPLGIVDQDRIVIVRRPAPREQIPIPAGALEQRVEIVPLAAGGDGLLVRSAVEAGVRGLVLEALGRGNIPPAAVREVESAIGARIPVVITSRCWHGRVLDTYAYEGGGVQLRKSGAILGDLLPSHKARLKLMLLLAAGAGQDEIRRSFESAPPPRREGV